MFLHRFRIDFSLIFGPSEPQKPCFYYSKSKVFAKSPFREKDRFCVSFCTIVASILVHFSFIFRYLFGIDFCIDFWSDFASILAPKLTPKWVPDPLKIWWFSHWAPRLFYSGLELLLSLVFSSFAGMRTFIFHWKIHGFVMFFHFTTVRVATDIALLFRLPWARKND